MRIAICLIAAYLIGSFPTAYLVAKAKGIDIRRVGSGNVGGSNIATVISRWLVFPVGITDLVKGAIAVFLAKWLDLDITWQVLSGLLAIAGHNWSIFLGFVGGRGIATSVGVLLTLLPLGFLILLPVFLLMLFLINSPIAFLASFAAVPFISWGLGKPLAVTLGFAGVFAILVTKRLIGNKGKPESDEPWRRIFLYRFFLDRDVRDKDDWVKR